MKACFIGHRDIDITEQLRLSIKETVVSLINKGVITFIFGSMSTFDNLSLEIVTLLKNEYPFIKRVYVRSSYRHINKSYEEYLLQSYEETYFPVKLENAGKCSYLERNYEMIDVSNFCIFYYDENYIPQSRHKSGTKLAYNYAIRKRKDIINLFNQS